MRINKYIAHSGLCSRRRADEMILKGRVSVNGRKITTPGYQVQIGKDIITVDGQRIALEEKKVVLLFSKPDGVTSTLKDPYAKKTLNDFFGDYPQRLFPVGRLDRDSTGLLVMTNDGKLSFELSHPSGEINKTYLVRVKGKPSRQAIEKLRTGIMLEDGKTLPAIVRFIKQDNRSSQWEIDIREGRNRQVRRMFDKIGHPVLSLRRIAIGKLREPNLQDGTYRELNIKEVNKLLGR